MENQFIIPRKLKLASLALVVIGLAIIVYAFITHSERAWANLLLNNYMFLSLAIGASFFYALQYISQSGWSAMFKRVPEAMMSFIPYSGVIMLLLYFGMHDLYHWTHEEAVLTDHVVSAKQPYLNIPFFFIRLVIFFIVWTVMTQLLKRASIAEDKYGTLAYFEKSEFLSKVHIFLLAITFSFATFDWIMSSDVHWYSTIFSIKNFISAFYHGCAVMTLIVILLYERGYFKDLNKSHLLDFSRYLFMLAIVWGYMTFSQFMIIWYGNIPEETIYYVRRWDGALNIIFYANFIINWFIPFIILLSQALNKNIKILKFVSILLIVGFYIDLYEQVIGNVLHEAVFGIIEVGFLMTFAGLFIYITAKALASSSLIPVNHPYLEESIYHHVH